MPLDVGWLRELGPLGAFVVLVLVMMRREYLRDKYLARFFVEREKTLAAIGENCHQFSRATEERSAKREQQLITTNEHLLTYLTKINGG